VPKLNRAKASANWNHAPGKTLSSNMDSNSASGSASYFEKIFRDIAYSVPGVERMSMAIRFRNDRKLIQEIWQSWKRSVPIDPKKLSNYEITSMDWIEDTVYLLILDGNMLSGTVHVLYLDPLHYWPGAHILTWTEFSELEMSTAISGYPSAMQVFPVPQHSS
jgi:hypothetical protein